MAFDFIFGENCIPGSSDVFNILLTLNEREDVEEFIRNTRIQTAGGESVVSKYQNDIVNLEKQAYDSFLINDYETAYKLYYEVIERAGDLSTDQHLICLMSVLIELERYSEAVIFVKHAINNGVSQLRSMYAWCYHAMGYQDFVKDYLKLVVIEDMFKSTQPAKLFNDTDLEYSVESVLNFDPAHSSWDCASFMLHQIQMHRHHRKIEAETIMAQRPDWFAKLKNNEHIMNLLSSVNLGSMTGAEMRFLENLLPFLDYWWQKMIVNKAITRELIEQHWLTKFLSRFSTTLTSCQSLVKMSSMIPGAFDALWRSWLCLTYPLLDSLSPKEKDTNPFSSGNFYPFTDFLWLANCLTLVIFDGIRLSCGVSCNSEPIIAPFVDTVPVFLKQLAAHYSFRDQLKEYNRDNFGKAVDLVLLLDQINFAEWKNVVFKKAKVGMGYRAITEPDVHSQLSRFITRMSHLLGSEEFVKLGKESFLLDHLSLFVHSANVTEFLAPNLKKFDRNDIVYLVDNFQLTPYACWISPSYRQLKPIADCRQFSEPFLRCITNYLFEISERLDNEGGLQGKDTLRIMMDAVHDLLSTKSECFIKLFYDGDGATSLLRHGVDRDNFFDKRNPVKLKLLVKLLENANEAVRSRWSKKMFSSLKNVALDFLDEIAIPGQKVKAKSFSNTIKVFETLVFTGPPIISFSTLTAEDCFGAQLDNLLVLSTRIMKSPRDTKTWPYSDVATLYEKLADESEKSGKYERQRLLLKQAAVEIRSLLTKV